MERDHQTKHSQDTLVLKAKDRYEQKRAELDSLDLQIRQGILNPKEADKLRAKRDKVNMQFKQADGDYRQGCDKLAEIVTNWKADMTACCMVSR